MELVYANITCVMEDERRKQTERKLIGFGKEEFLKKDMQKPVSARSAKRPV